MIYKLFFFLFLAISCIPCAAEHLTIHFDLNQTIIPTDCAGRKELRDVIAHSLSKTVEGFWYKEQKRKTSYFDYIYNEKFTSPRKNQAVKAEKLRLLSAFPNYLQEINHPKAEEIREKFSTVLEKARNNPRKVIPAFYALLKHLEKENVSYTLVLRTFGGDLAAISEEIERETAVRFSTRGKFVKKVLHLDNGLILSTPQAISDYLATHHVAIQDDYYYWNGHNELGAYGKPLPIPSAGNVLFFDDHVNQNSLSLVNVVAPMSAETGWPLTPSPFIKQGQIVKVNIVDAILEENYFIAYCDTLRRHLQDPPAK